MADIKFEVDKHIQRDELHIRITGDEQREVRLKQPNRKNAQLPPVLFVADTMIMFVTKLDGNPWRCDGVRIIGHNPNGNGENDLEVYHRPSANGWEFPDWAPGWLAQYVDRYVARLNGEY